MASTSISIHGPTTSSSTSPIATSHDTHLFEEAVKLIQVIERARAHSTTVREFFERMHGEGLNIDSILKRHPEASSILALAVVHLIKTNQWQLLHLTRDFFRAFNSEIFRLSGWSAVTFNQPLELTEIRKMQNAYFKMKGTEGLSITYNISPTLMERARDMQEGQMIGVIASFRDRQAQNPDNPHHYPLVQPIYYTGHKTPVLMQKVNGELRIFIADSIVDKIVHIRGQDYIFPMQADIIEQIRENLAPGTNPVFYRFPNSIEDRPETPKENFEYMNKRRRQTDGTNCSAFAVHDIRQMCLAAREPGFWESLDAQSDPNDTQMRVVWHTPEWLMYPAQGLSSIIGKHPKKEAITEVLHKKNCIAPDMVDSGKILQLNKLSDRLRYKYHHLSQMVPGDILDRQFLREWATYRRTHFPTPPTLTFLPPLPVHEIMDAIQLQTRTAAFTESQLIQPFFNQLPEEFRNDVYSRVYELHGRPHTSDVNWGGNNLYSDMKIFHRALREVFNPGAVYTSDPAVQVQQTPILTDPIQILQAIHDRSNIARQAEGRQLQPLFDQLPQDFRNQVYARIWELHGKPISDDSSWGEHNLFNSLDYFHIALRDVAAANAYTASCSLVGSSADRFYTALHIFLLQLPQENRDRLYEEIRILGGGPEGDLNWGQEHRYDDMNRFYRALGKVFTSHTPHLPSAADLPEHLLFNLEGHLRTFLNEIPAESRDAIYENIWIYGGRIAGDPNWGQNHAFESLPRLWMAITSALPARAQTTVDPMPPSSSS